MSFTFQYLPIRINGNNFFIAFAEYEPYSFLNGGKFLKVSTNFSFKLCLFAKVVNAFSNSFLSLVEYRISHNCSSISFDKNEASISAFFMYLIILPLVSLQG